MKLVLDRSNKGGARALGQLEQDLVGWLTTVNPDGQPQSSPIWFIWRDGEIMTYSHKAARRNAHIESNPLVAFNLNNPDGNWGVTMEGVARIDRTVRPSTGDPDYQTKYGTLMKELEWTPEWVSGEYPVPLFIRPTRWRLA